MKSLILVISLSVFHYTVADSYKIPKIRLKIGKTKNIVPKSAKNAQRFRVDDKLSNPRNLASEKKRKRNPSSVKPKPIKYWPYHDQPKLSPTN